MSHENDLIRRGDVIAILSAASRMAQKTIDAIAAIPAALAASQTADPVTNAGCCQAVRVRPLEWRETNGGNCREGEIYSARSLVNFAPIAAHKKHDGWWLNVDCKTYPTLEAAKAAAQADYEARILSAIEPAPVTLAEALQVPEVQALVESLEWYISEDATNTGDEPLDDRGGRTWNEINAYWIEGKRKAIAAIAAMKEG